MRKVVMYGAAHAFALKTLRAINDVEPTWQMLGFLDDDETKRGDELYGHPILGDRTLLPELVADDTYVFNNIMGHWSRRKTIAELLDAHRCRLAGLVDPRIDELDLQYGEGVFVGAYAHFGASARMGDGAVVMQGSMLGDDTVIDADVFVANMALVGSRSTVGAHTFIGPGAVILPDITIGSRAVIGAGSTVTRDVGDDAQVFGPPARPR